MPESLLADSRTFGVDAERLSAAELFLLRRCDSIAAVVRGIMWDGGSSELGFPCSKDVEIGSNAGSITGWCISSGADAMTKSFIFLTSSVARLEVGGRDRYLSFTFKVFPAAI